jgi:release factor glutamine methyltransferase
MLRPPMTVAEALRAASERLHAAGVASARHDAQRLLAHVLGLDRAALLTRTDIGADETHAFDDLVARRVAREPLQHLLGRAPFRYLDLAVGPGVFIPRPETELLVDAVLPHLAAADGPTVVDLCSGSGALALAIAHELPGSRVTALERSPDALVWLRANAAATTVMVVAGDVADPHVLAELDGQVDAVVSNPPYVPAGTEVGAEVGHDPREAVFAGPDGLALMPAVISTAARLLRPGGVLAIEHDDTHEHAVPSLLQDDGRWDQIADHHDLTGRPRFATATRSRCK